MNSYMRSNENDYWERRVGIVLTFLFDDEYHIINYRRTLAIDWFTTKDATTQLIIIIIVITKLTFIMILIKCENVTILSVWNM